MQYPRNVIPDFFADHIGNLTVELVLAAVEIATLIVHVPPNLETLAVLQEAEAFPGNEPEGKCLICDISGLKFNRYLKRRNENIPSCHRKLSSYIKYIFLFI